MVEAVFGCNCEIVAIRGGYRMAIIGYNSYNSGWRYTELSLETINSECPSLCCARVLLTVYCMLSISPCIPGTFLFYGFPARFCVLSVLFIVYFLAFACVFLFCFVLFPLFLSFLP